MRTRNLLAPDPQIERYEPQYSPTVAASLKRAYWFAQAGEFDSAFTTAVACIGDEMSLGQRLRLFYILSLSAASAPRLEEAHDWNRAALDLAVPAEDLSAVATLDLLGGSIAHNRQLFRDAAIHYARALDAIRNQSGENIPDPAPDPREEFDALDGLATESFLLAHYEESRHYITMAQAIALPQHRERPLLAAKLNWTSALLARWAGQPGEALQYAMAAFDIIGVHGSALSRTRLRIVLSDTLLDLANSASSGPRLHLLGNVEEHLLPALADARVSGDEPGEAMAQLAYARYLRATRRYEDRLAIIAFAERTARRLNDLPLLGQALAATGDELMALGERDSSLHAYGEALDVLHKSQAPAYIAWTQRALHLVREHMSDKTT